MCYKKRVYTYLLLILVTLSVTTPLTSSSNNILFTKIDENIFQPSATELIVTNRTFNGQNAFNDDDLEIFVYNSTTDRPIAQANVTLYNATDLSNKASKLTIGDGSAIFMDIPQGTYIWNVTWSLAPNEFKWGYFISDGPEVLVNIEFGNLDWNNADDDINATITSIDGNPAEGLNFSIHHRDNGSLWNRTTLGPIGVANFSDIPIGNYTWKVVITSGDYEGLVVAQSNFTSDGTSVFLHQLVGPLYGKPEFYDLEVFVYYETSIYPVMGAVINVTYANGSEISLRTTPGNGTVIVLDLPIAFINWSITYQGEHLGNSPFFRNLTTTGTDLQPPIIMGPGDQEFLYDTENITLTWHIEDTYPSRIEVWVDGNENVSLDWVNQTYDYTFNVSDAFTITGEAIGYYEIELVALDENGNDAHNITSLRLFENVTPIINSSKDVEFYHGETGYSIDWNVSDEFMNMYAIFRDDTEIDNGTLDPTEPFVSVSLDSLDIGTYVYKLQVNDTSGNVAFSNVTVKAKRDDISPVITYSPPLVSYSRGDTEIIRNWTATDNFKSSYEITVDGVLTVQKIWDTEIIEFDFSGLSDGNHTVVLTVYDKGGNSASSTVEVLVYPPIIVTGLLVIGVIVISLFVIIGVVWYIRFR
jgi:hypothetical protein